MIGSTQRHPIRIVAAAIGLALALCFTGCSAQSELDGSTGKRLQEQVGHIRVAMAGGNYAAALSALDSLEADVGRSTAEGRISEARKTRILDALTLVRKDALAAMPSTPPPAPSPSPEATPSKPQDENNKDRDKKQEKEEKGEGKEDEGQVKSMD